jgi:hypothetical protein
MSKSMHRDSHEQNTALMGEEEGGEGGVDVAKMPGARDKGGEDSSFSESSGRPSASAFKASL